MCLSVRFRTHLPGNKGSNKGSICRDDKWLLIIHSSNNLIDCFDDGVLHVLVLTVAQMDLVDAQKEKDRMYAPS